MIGWSGAPQGWDKAAVPWRQTIFLPRGSAGIERLQGMQVKLIPTMIEQLPRQMELSGDYELELEYTSASADGMQHCKMRLPFRVGLPAWWREQQAEKLRIDAVSTEAEVLSPQILEFRARLLVQTQSEKSAEVYRPDPAAEKLLQEYEDVINAPETEEPYEAPEIALDLAELKAAALDRLQNLRPPVRPTPQQTMNADIEEKREEEIVTEPTTNQTIMAEETAAEIQPQDKEEVLMAEELVEEPETAAAAAAIEAADTADAEEDTEVIAEEIVLPKPVLKPVVAVAKPEKQPVYPIVSEPVPDDGMAYRLRFVRQADGWQQL